MNASVLDRFIFRTATAIRATPAIPYPVSTVQTPEVARITGIAVANPRAGELFDTSADASNEPTEAPSDWWETLRARIDECDRLINELCDIRKDDDAHRADLLAVRKRMAPEMLVGDIAYLKSEIVTSTPPPRQTRGRCIDCLSFVGTGTVKRCSHGERSPASEPPRAQTLPDNQCGLFQHWRNP